MVRGGEASGGSRVETVSVLFTDLAGSTELRARVGEDEADRLQRVHDSLVADAIESNRGTIVKSTGDGVMATFAGAIDAVAAAVVVQQAMHGHNRRNPEGQLRVRIGISAGDVRVEADGDCFGLPVVEAQRLEATATPGQILCSSLVQALARGRGEHWFRSVGELALKGIPDPIAADEVLWEPPGAGHARALPPVLAATNDFAFAGRQHELDVLVEAWKASVAGPGRLVLLGGEPGIGKTRLVRELAAFVLDEDGVVLAGRSDEGLPTPYGPFADAVVWWGQLDDDADLGDDPDELFRIAPALSASIPTATARDAVRSDGDATVTIRAIKSWLRATVARQPALLVLDDLHWADAASLLVVRSLFDRDPVEGLLVVATYRDTELDRRHPLAGVLADLRRVDGVTRVAVTGLDEHDVEEFVAGAAGHELDDPARALAAEVWRETAGNPFFVGEVLRHLAETGAIVERDGVWTSDVDPTELGIPEGIREVVGRRLSRLSDDADQALTTASVIGLEFDLSIVAAASGRTEDEILDALDDAQRAALVSEVAGDTWRFAHAIVRDTLLSEIPGARRLRMHRKIAIAIEGRAGANTDAVATALAHHWGEAAAAGADTDTAIAWGTRAGDLAVGKGAVDDAVRWYEHTLGLFDPDQPADRRQGELWVRLARAHALTPGTALRGPVFRAADVALALEDHQLLTDALIITNRASAQLDEVFANPELVNRLEHAVDLVGRDEPVRRALLLAALAIELTLANQGDERQVRLCDEALDLARVSGDDDAVAAAFLAYFIAMPQRLMREDVMRQLVDEVQIVADRLIETDTSQRTIHLLAHICHSGFLLGRPELLDQFDRTMVQLAQARPSPRVMWELEGRRAMRAVVTGDLESAELGVGRLMPMLADRSTESVFVGALQIQIGSERDQLDLVLPPLEAAAAASRSVTLETLVAHTLAVVGDLPRAELALDALLDAGIENVPDDPGWNTTIAWLVETSILLGRTPVAPQLADAIDVWPFHHLYNGGVYLGSPSRLRGNLAHLNGDDDAAMAHYEQAIIDHEALGAVPWLATTRLDQAQLWLDRGDRERAAAYARDALDDIGDLPLIRRKNRALETLQRIGL